MAQGLDELIESLVGEVAFFGEGCAVSDIFRYVRKYGKDDEAVDDSGNNAAAVEAAAKAPLTDADLRLGRLIWPHIVSTGHVKVGAKDKWKHLTFDEIVSLPEEKAEGSGASIPDIEVRLTDQQPERPQRSATEKSSKDKKFPKVRPRLFVGEELVWKTLTGHGIDYKRIPPLEWKLVEYIGSTKEIGISQPDLVRATGQDKRSVPRRTDFLCIKGYIVKRTHMIRGMKTSKLWLPKFAPELPAPSAPLKGLELSKDVLTKDMGPVPWVHQWVGNKTAKGKEELAYHALVQTIMACVQAWGTLRLRDLKMKLGVMGLKWQMKIVSRFLRRANERGNLTYTAAQFPGNNVIFKDCIKFMREPTEEDWRILLATGAKSKPSYDRRTGKKIKKKGKGKKPRGRPPAIQARRITRILKKRFRHPPSPAVVRWTPEKPFANTLVEYILTGGKEGYTTIELSNALVGTEFYRYMHNYMSNMCTPDNQPPSLSEYQMTTELTRSGKTQAYVFRCAGPPSSDVSEIVPETPALDPKLAQQLPKEEEDSAAFGFGPVNASAFIERGPTDLSSLAKVIPTKKSLRPKRVYNRRLASEEPLPAISKQGRPRKPKSAEVADVDAAHAAPARRGRKRKAAQRVSYVDNLDRLIEGASTGSDAEPTSKCRTAGQAGSAEPLEAAEQSSAESIKTAKTEASEETEKTPDRTLPGVYYGVPGSLNPDPHKKGRPRKSIVLIFRSDKLKDPDFMPGWSKNSGPQGVSRPPPRKPVPCPTALSAAGTASGQASTPKFTPSKVPVALPALGQSADASLVGKPSVVAGQEIGDPTNVGQDNSKVTSESSGVPMPMIMSDLVAVNAQSSLTPESAALKQDQRQNLQAIKPNAAGLYVCVKCNGSWANDNGLKYHLTKGKNLCNPFYAENPGAMHRARANRGDRYASSESADPGSPVSSAAHKSSDDSLASEPEPSPEPASVPKAKKQAKKPRKLPAKKDRSVSRVLEPAERIGPAKPRPVLKPRSAILKARHLGSSGVLPRGVEASEAAAMRMAVEAELQAQDTAATPSGAVKQIADGEYEEFWEPDEELPCLKHMHSQNAESFSQRKNSEDTSSNRSGRIYDHQLAEEPQKTIVDISSADYNLPSASEALGASDPYPAELLNPALRTMADSDAPLDPATNIQTTTRILLPVPRAASPDDLRNSVATEPSQPTSSAPSFPPSIRMPTSKFAGKKGKHIPLQVEKQVLPFRIQEIIQYLITSNGGLFPKDRKTLHWAVLKVFRATFSSPNGILPTAVGTARAVSALEKDKLVKTGSVAIQPAGHWKQYDIVYLPAIQIKTDPVVSHLKAQAEAVDPEMYIPSPFAPTEDEKALFSSLDRPTKERGKGPGRRDHKLDAEIATLNAPFYKENGLAGVRPRLRRARLGSESEGEGRDKKRRTRTATDLAIMRKRLRGDDDDDGHSGKRKRGRRRRNLDEEYVILEPSKLSIDGSNATNPGISSLPATFFCHSAPFELNFLTPNTHLEDDYVPSTPSDLSVPDFENEEEKPTVPTGEKPTVPTGEKSTVPTGTCADTVELHENSKGVWPSLPNLFFMESGGSFTMKGWLPSQSERPVKHMPRTSPEIDFKITSHCKKEQWADPALGVFLTSLDGCRAWELSEAGKHFMSDPIAPQYMFINFSSTQEVSNMAPIGLQWLDENEWTLQTIPYEQLEDHDDDPYLQYDFSSIKTSTRGPGRPPKPKPAEGLQLRKYHKRVPKDPTIRELKVKRELTPYPTVESDYFRLKGEQSLGIDWKAEDTRIAAYVAVSTLTGGINKAMDWGLMMRLFPESKLSNLRKFWSTIKKEREAFINNLSEKFQEEFLGPYENGELGEFDFDEPLKYDWLKLVKWTLALVVRETIELPPSRPRFDEELEVIYMDKNDYDWRDTYYHWQRSVFNKFQDATSEPASRVIDIVPDSVDNDKVIARSWFRALCCTDPQRYTPYKIRDKFKALVREGHRSEQQVSDLLEATVLDLEHRRISIKARAQALATGRPYRLNEHFLATLDRFANEIKFAVAADFKLKLDQAFKKGETVDLPWRTEDGMVLAAFNLQAAGRVRIEPKSKLDIPFGFKPGFYESRKFPKSYYRFDLHITPTSRYAYNEDIDVLHGATLPENIPTTTEDGKLPMWCDFFGAPDRGRWFKMLAGVLFAYATRGAMTDDFTTQALKPCYEQFEVEIIRKWGTENGLLCELTVPGGPVTVTEWWWLVLGQPMLDMAPVSAVGKGEGRAAPAENGGRRTKDQYEEWNSGRSRRRGKHRVL